MGEMAKKIARHLDEQGLQLDVERGLSRLRSATDVPTSKRNLWWLAAIVPLALAALFISWPRPDGGLTYVVEHGRLLFSDGSRFTIDEGAGAQVVAVDARGAEVRIERGAIVADVVHRPKGRWRVSAGPFMVRVTGTTFRVAWDEKSEVFALSMREGSVVLSGPVVGDHREVRAPEEITVRMRDGELKVGSAHDVSDEETAPSEPEAHAGVPVRAPTVPKAERPARRQSRLQVDPAQAASASPPSAAELLATAQEARLKGDGAAAARALLLLTERYPHSVEAQTALFLSGKLAFDGGRHSHAVSALQSYLGSAPTGTFAGEARVLLILALDGAGRHGEAQTMARAYLAQHPGGAHTPRIRKVLSRTKAPRP